MKAVTYKKYGSVDNFVFNDTYPEPTLNDGEILVKVVASSINHVDVMIRRAEYRLLGGFFGPRFKLLGRDFSGEVIESKAKDGLYKKGDKVFGLQFTGTSAELIKVKPQMLAHAPKTISLEEAAGYPLVTLTSIQALKTLAKFHAGQTIFINGVGSVGVAAVYMAQALGAARIDGTTAKSNFEAITKLPITNVYDYQNLNWSALPIKYDLVYDTNGRASQNELFKALKDGGTAVTTHPMLHWRELLFNKLWGGSKKFKANLAMPSHDGLVEAAKLIDDQGLRLKIAAKFSLAEYKLAQTKLEQGVEGKVLVIH